MNQILFKNRDRFNSLDQDKSEPPKKKKRKSTKDKSLEYPYSTKEVKFKTFQIKYDGQLSLVAKFLLNNFQNKYIYYAIDDVLYHSGLKSTEYETLLAILYSPVLLLQNNRFISFFDIWISDIYINEVSKTNKFLSKTSEIYGQVSYITIKFIYTTREPAKKPDPIL